MPDDPAAEALKHQEAAEALAARAVADLIAMADQTAAQAEKVARLKSSVSPGLCQEAEKVARELGQHVTTMRGIVGELGKRG